MHHATIYHYTPGVRDYVKSPPVNELLLSKQERIRTSALRFLLQPDLLAELLFGNTLWPIRFEIAFNSTVSIKHCQCHDYCKKRKKDNQPPPGFSKAWFDKAWGTECICDGAVKVFHTWTLILCQSPGRGLTLFHVRGCNFVMVLMKLINQVWQRAHAAFTPLARDTSALDYLHDYLQLHTTATLLTVGLPLIWCIKYLIKPQTILSGDARSSFELNFHTLLSPDLEISQSDEVCLKSEDNHP